MFINEVISYNGAWDCLNKHSQNLFKELESLLESIDSQRIECIFEQEKNGPYPLNLEIFSKIYDELKKLNCSYEHIQRDFIEGGKNYLIYNKDILVDCMVFESELLELVYGEDFFCMKLYDLSASILLARNYTYPDLFNFFDIENKIPHEDDLGLLDTKGITIGLEKIGIHNLTYPLLILGLGFKKENRKIQHIEPQNIKVNRCITFAPEYYQAGLSILNYFGTVLRNKYPEQKATVKIEQHENMVRMIVESENGDKDIIEKALYEYELVMSGQTSVEDFYQDPIQTLELRNQIRMMQFQVESQREIVALKNGHIQTLQDLLRQALKQPQAPITVNSYLTNQQTVNVNHKNELNHSYDLLDELIDAVKDESLKNQLRDLQNALDQSKNLEQAAQVKDSSGFKKLSKFIKQANDTSSDVHGILDKTDKAIGLIEKLTAHYDKLVQFTSGLI